MIIDLPKSGYKVELRDYLTTEDHRVYQRVILGDAPLNIKKDQEEIEIPMKMSAFYEAQDMLLGRLLVSVKDKEGNVIPNEKLQETPAEDGALVYEQVTKITELINTGETQKKIG